MGKRDRRNSNKMKQRKGQTKKKARLKRQAEARGKARTGGHCAGCHAAQFAQNPVRTQHHVVGNGRRIGAAASGANIGNARNLSLDIAAQRTVRRHGLFDGVEPGVVVVLRRAGLAGALVRPVAGSRARSVERVQLQRVVELPGNALRDGTLRLRQ